MRDVKPEVLQAGANGLGRSHLGALAGGDLDVLHIFLGLDVNDGGLPINHGIQNIICTHPPY